MEEFQFVVECDALFELQRQIRATVKTGRIDDSDFCEIEIGFDPAIARATLKEPISPAMARIFAQTGAKDVQWQALRSSAWKKVVVVTGKTRLEDRQLEFVLGTHRDGLRRYAELLEERVPQIAEGQGYVWLHRILTAVIELPFWDAIARERVLTPNGSLVWGEFRRDIRFVATPAQIHELVSGGATPMVTRSGDKLIFAEREVRT